MRFSRDRRGYEHTYVLHTSRGQSRQEPRILYWFRTPPHVRVGRAAIDEEAIRLLEEAHPDVSFEWSHMLKAQPPPAPPAEELPRRRGRQRKPDQRPRRPASAPTAAEPARPRIVEPPVEPQLTEPQDIQELVESLEPLESLEPMERLEPIERLEPLEPLEQLGPHDALEPVESVEALGRAEPEPLLDPGILERLRARYAELMARISQRIADPVQRDVLRGEAERLNPETWVTAEEARNGLEHFERWFETIRAQLPAAGRSRRRRRRKRGGRGPEPPSGPAGV